MKVYLLKADNFYENKTYLEVWTYAPSEEIWNIFLENMSKDEYAPKLKFLGHEGYPNSKEDLIQDLLKTKRSSDNAYGTDIWVEEHEVKE